MFVSKTDLAAVYTGIKAVWQQGWDGASASSDDYKQVAYIAPSDTQQEEYPLLEALPVIREWVGERQVRNIEETSYIIKNKTFEGTVGLKREKIKDRQLGGAKIIAQQLGRDARNFPNTLVFQLLKDGFTKLCYDGQPLFHTDHPQQRSDGTVVSVSNTGGGAGEPWFLIDDSQVIRPIIFQERDSIKFGALDSDDKEHAWKNNEYLFGVDGRCNVGFGPWQLAYGSKQPLTEASYEAARLYFNKLKRVNGDPMGFKPTLLVVGPGNEKAALEVVKRTYGAGGAENIYAGSVKLLVTNWL